MRKGTLARLEINASLVLVALLLAVVGYGVVSALSDRLDPKVRTCVARSQQAAADAGRPQTRDTAVKLCKHLQEIGALH
jgi:hypothetical protein